MANVLTLDFWDTLYRHCLTPEHRKAIREAELLRYCQTLGCDAGELIASTAFSLIDGYIKAEWKKGVCPSREGILGYLSEAYEHRHSHAFLNSVVEELNRIYTTVLRPELFDGTTDFLLWARARMNIYLISDTYTIGGATLDLLLEQDDLLSAFRNRFYSDVIGYEKPDERSIHQIATWEKIVPSKIIHVGDLIERDYELARRSGCKFILLQHAKVEREIPPDSEIAIGTCNSFEQVRNTLEAVID